jgi:hypothetical protein
MAILVSLRSGNITLNKNNCEILLTGCKQVSIIHTSQQTTDQPKGRKMQNLHDAHVVERDGYMDAIAWEESCDVMREAEGRWVDNGCSNIENYEEY